MTRIYTRTGDGGTTGLIGGKRISKDAARLEAYGTIDELNAVLGMVRSRPLPERAAEALRRVQDDLFTIGAGLALPEGEDARKRGVPPLGGDAVRALEREIDACESELAPLHEFILPGGSSCGSLLHLARTVARRAERRCVALRSSEKIDPNVIPYLNRLSDLCFVLARYVNHRDGSPEEHPSYGRTPDRSA